MRNFSDFLDRQDRQNKQHLNVLMHLCDRAGFKVVNHLSDRTDPYFFVRKPNDLYPELDNLGFHGVRVYARGKNIIAFRCQNKADTEPFGGAFPLDVSGMYKSLIRDNMKQEKLGKEIAKYLVDEILNFFFDSADAEQSDTATSAGEGSFGKIMITGGTGTDYANTVTGPGFGSSAGR